MGITYNEAGAVPAYMALRFSIKSECSWSIISVRQNDMYILLPFPCVHPPSPYPELL